MFISICTEAVLLFLLTACLLASARDKHCSICTAFKGWLQKAEVSTVSHCWLEKQDLCFLCHQPFPAQSYRYLTCTQPSSSPCTPCWRQWNLLWLSGNWAGAPIWQAEFCVKYSVSLSSDHLQKAFCFLPSPLARMSPTPREWWKWPHHTTALSSGSKTSSTNRSVALFIVPLPQAGTGMVHQITDTLELGRKSFFAVSGNLALCLKDASYEIKY